MQKKSLLLLTTASLAANPRLVKEFEFLKKQFDCTVICFWHNDWSEDLSREIIQNNPEVNFVTIDRKNELLATLVAKFLHQLAIFLNPILKNHLSGMAYASNDKTPQLVWKALGQLKRQNFDAVIAHNLGAFLPAMKIAKIQDAHLQLDVEDFYPGEALYFNKNYEKENRHSIMQAAFQQVNCITYASEGIAQKCRDTYVIPSTVKQATIINSFCSTDFSKPQTKSDSIIRCVWFSQHIGPNRGLEQVFDAAKTYPNFKFHLIGNVNQTYLVQEALASNIHIHPIMPQADLHRFLGNMDIGLALELESADENRNICLTNKILAYAQAGLYILATPTLEQKQFLESLPYEAGFLLEKDLTYRLERLDLSKLGLSEKINRWKQAKAFSWEQEQQKLLKVLS